MNNPFLYLYFVRSLYATLLATLLILTPFARRSLAQESPKLEYVSATNLSYYSDAELARADEYQKSQCVLDILYPKEVEKPFATIVWFHGGGLTGGQKYVPSAFKRLKAYQEGRLAIVAVGYRLSPKVPYPVFIEDAAAATAWVVNNIAKFGGDSNSVFVSGGSAGGYLTAMIGAYPWWLNARGCDPKDLAGLIPISGQMTTHFHVKELLRYSGSQYNPVIDENAPLGGLSPNFPPIFFILGDRRIEWKCRVEENELMASSLRALGAPLVEFSENEGFDHSISVMGDDITSELLDKLDAFIVKAQGLRAH